MKVVIKQNSVSACKVAPSYILHTKNEATIYVPSKLELEQYLTWLTILLIIHPMI